MANDLERQIESELKEILNAPTVNASYVIVGRCSFCGQTSDDLTPVETVQHGRGQVERKKCRKCAGG
jgi:hypothetical protein